MDKNNFDFQFNLVSKLVTSGAKTLIAFTNTCIFGH